MMTHWTLT